MEILNFLESLSYVFCPLRGYNSSTSSTSNLLEIANIDLCPILSALQLEITASLTCIYVYGDMILKNGDDKGETNPTG